jgi:DNA-binding CsgD family transcriptional regulator
VSWREWSVHDGSQHGFSFSADEPALTAATWAAYAQFRGQDPLPAGCAGAHARTTLAGHALKFSDILSMRELRRLELHAYVCRPLGVDYVMKLFLPARDGIAAALVFDRGRRDFSERDRLVLELLQPHLASLRVAAHNRRVLAALEANEPSVEVASLTRREREILELVAEGRSNAEIAERLWISVGTVRIHLQHVYEKLGVRSRTAALARVRGYGIGK